MMLASGCGMMRETLKILLSVAGAGAGALCVLVAVNAIFAGSHGQSAGALLFRFQLSALLAMALFAGLAIVIYVRLSRYLPPGKPLPYGRVEAEGPKERR